MHSAKEHSNQQSAKAALRGASLKRRDAIDGAARIEASLAASDLGSSLAALQDFDPGTVVSGYHPIRSELDPRPLMATLAGRGARLCLPAVTGKTTIEFRELVRGAPLFEGGFGTSSPGPDAPVLQPQILLMPLSAFDLQGNRIGYGAGHYDRYIEKLIAAGIAPKLIGLAFATQQVDEVPFEAHDRPLNCIITEERIITPVEANQPERQQA